MPNPPVSLSKPVARNTSTDKWDIKQVKKALNRLGYYLPLESIGITGIPDEAVFKGIKNFQSDHGLPVTGEIRPGDKTLEILNSEAAKTPDGYYIWRTVGDGKVRKTHAQYNGQIRAWADAPDPGEDYGCRCWAELSSILADVTNEEILESLEKEEYFVEYMYLDSEGNVTVGIGTMLPNEKSAQDLPFIISDPKSPNGIRPATINEIANAYKKLKLKPHGNNHIFKGFSPSSKNGLDNIRIKRSIAVNRTTSHLQNNVKNLRKKFSKFDTYPVEVRKAMLDMEYNMGGNFNRTKWNDFFKAVDKEDWPTAAKESHRKQVSEQRNNRIYKLFEKAGQN